MLFAVLKSYTKYFYLGVTLIGEYTQRQAGSLQQITKTTDCMKGKEEEEEANCSKPPLPTGFCH